MEQCGIRTALRLFCMYLFSVEIMKARVKATGEIWTFSQIDEITFKSAINGHLYCAEELEFLEPSVFSPDYWTRLEHQYAGMAMQGILSNEDMQKELMRVFGKEEAIEDTIVDYAKDMAQLLVKKMKEEMK